ncbi:hypothetical protein EJC51_47490 [Streptomyces aquilus]|uniref:Uncharacterized protein n=1 Tax=Streptomyces aquilus TaxID=2548456 RepID=A0A3Q9BUH1_9ACTN|nr:hypothetical protein [Streptomyces aquilus]AZP14709.1 hypothetical protein EJC51_00055 [Streptomyces aquilus]AZP22995.1 hypothetical protein EJC51_47490 [Streptomyces aquilus]
MTSELTTQEEFDAFADDVARELGTHCRTAELTDHHRGLGRLIIDGDGRALRLSQPDHRHPNRLKIHAALPDEARMLAPSIGVTARSARHVAREITRRLYPLHAEAVEQAAEIAARQEAEERGRRAVTEAVAGALPGARIEEQYRRTRIIWQHDTRPPGQHGPVQVDSVTVLVGPSGHGVQVEASGRPESVTAMLAAFAQASQE